MTAPMVLDRPIDGTWFLAYVEQILNGRNGARPRGDPPRHILWIQAHRPAVDISEDGFSPSVNDGVRRRCERHRRDNHLISGLQSDHNHGQMESGRTGIDCERVARANVIPELDLESGYLRTSAKPARA